MLIYMVKYMHNTSTSSYYLLPVLKLCQPNLKIAQNNLWQMQYGTIPRHPLSDILKIWYMPISRGWQKLRRKVLNIVTGNNCLSLSFLYSSSSVILWPTLGTRYPESSSSNLIHFYIVDHNFNEFMAVGGAALLLLILKSNCNKWLMLHFKLWNIVQDYIFNYRYVGKCSQRLHSIKTQARHIQTCVVVAALRLPGITVKLTEY